MISIGKLEVEQRENVGGQGGSYNGRVIAERILNRLVERLAAALAPPAEPLRPWIVDGNIVGYLDGERAASLERWRDVFIVHSDAVHLQPGLETPSMRTAALDQVAHILAAEGALTGWRDERYAVSCAGNAAPLLLLERAAARFFGIATEAAHVNGTTPRGGATWMWIARRSITKAIDPGQLDNLVGGGIAAGADIPATVVKEAWEEAGIHADLARTARPAGAVHILRTQPDGLHRETIHVHDLELPADFAPSNQDGEVTAFRLAPAEEVAVLAASSTGEDVITADASLVIADWLLRHDHVSVRSTTHARLERLRRGERP